MEGRYWGDIAKDETFEQFRDFVTPETVDAKDRCGRTAIFHATLFRQPMCFAHALECGADVNQIVQHSVYEKSTLLHLVDRRKLYLAICLLKKQANVNARNDYGETPLHIAAADGNNKYVTLLLESKADVNATDECGETPLDSIATTPRKADIVCARTLLLAGGKMGEESKERYADSEIWLMRRRFMHCRLACRATQRALTHQGKIHKDVISLVVAMVWETKDDKTWNERSNSSVSL